MRPPFTITAIALALAAPLAAGCGGDDEQEGQPIPAEQAAALERQLESIENRFQFGGDACADITGNEDPNTTAVENVLASLPQNVDPDVRDSLEQSFDRLFQLVEEQCDEEKGQETETEAAPPPPETDTEPTETVPPPEEEEGDDGGEGEGEEEAPPPEEEVPPEEVPPGQDGESGPGQGGELPGQGGGGGAIVPGDDG